MKTNPLQGKRGYVSYLLVIATGLCLTFLMLHAYKKAIIAQEVQGKITLKVDYREKQDAFLRSVVAITPNRAIRAMQAGSSPEGGESELSWSNIFDDALDQANARRSISAAMLAEVSEGKTTTSANAGDSNMTDKVFVMIKPLQAADGDVTSGVNQNFGPGYPPALNWDTSSDAASKAASFDGAYPVISKSKKYGKLADGLVMLSTEKYPNFNQITYPEINFGYAEPGELFVAKRNWWAFTMDISAADAAATQAPAERREFVLSIYEVPAQLAISSNTFTNLGQFSNNTAWDADRVKIQGGVYAGRAETSGGIALDRLAAHRGVDFGAGSTVGGSTFDSKAFAAGEREKYEFNNKTSMPVSLPTESGRAAFVPINRGSEFLDRYAVLDVDANGKLVEESGSLSDTTWNNYSVGAMQCAMHLDVLDVAAADDQLPQLFEFTYKAGGAEQSKVFPIGDFNNNQTGTAPAPFQIVIQNNAGIVKPCIIFMPQRMPKFLESLGADDVSVNHSISINVNYKSTVDQRDTRVRKPALLPSQGPSDIAIILRECEDLRDYTKGFSLVTNLRLYIGDNFNTWEGTPPADYTLASGEKFYPPTSLFTPEKRFGMEVDPRTLEIAGQVGSLASSRSQKVAHILDAKGREGNAFDTTKLKINLKPSHHPALLPPVTMMNWLVTVEEKRAEFQ